MKKIKYTFVAILMLCTMQGVLAVAPGGALGGGSKKGQVQKESSPKMETPGEAPAMLDVSQEMIEASSLVEVQKPTTTSKVAIGKQSQEGQSSEMTDPENFEQLSLAKMQKQDARKLLKKKLKALRAKAKSDPDASSSMADDMLVLLVILCFVLPPLAVYLALGTIGFEFWLSVLLTLLFLVPGIIYALYVVLS